MRNPGAEESSVNGKNFAIPARTRRLNGWPLHNVVDNTTLFDFSGNALPALDAFEFNN